ncbi:hypothetical protein Tco_1194547 [Tanacetum coccineum]
MEIFISDYPTVLKKCYTSKPQTLEEVPTIAKRLMDHIIRHDYVQETNDHKRKLEDKRNIIKQTSFRINTITPVKNDYHQQQNRRQETFRTYAATNGYTGNRPLCERLRDVAIYYHFAISTFPVEIVIKSSAFILVIKQLMAQSGMDLKMAKTCYHSHFYTPTPPQIFEIGKSSIKMCLKHHEEQIEDILNYLEELSFHLIEKIKEGHINRMIIQRNSDELKTKLKRVHSQIIKLQRKQLGQRDKIAFAHFRISDLEQIIEEIQARHQMDQEDL